MTFRGDDRAVTVQIGAVLLFGFLVVAMSTYQVTVVPAETEAAEFEHSREVQTDLLDLRSAAHRAAVAGGAHPTTVDLGVTYPRRTFFVNPPPARGDAETVAVGDGTLTVSNAAADAPEVADYWNGTDRSFDTKTVRYRPTYNQYADAPRTAYGNTVVYNRFGNGHVGNLSEQTLVDGRRVSPVLVGGGLSKGGTGARSITPRAVSAASRTVSVRGDGGGNVTLTLPTRLSAETWRSLLASELDGTGDETDDRYVHAVRNVSAEAVEIEMEANATYDLRVAKVGFGSEPEPEPYYVTRVTEASGVAAGSARTVAFEVRDRYDNPVTGARVNVSLAEAVPGDGRETLSVGDASGDRLVGLTTDADGRVTVEYAAPASADGAGTAAVTAELSDPAADASAAAAEATAEFDVSPVGGDGTGGTDSYDVEWNLTEIAGENGITGCSEATTTCAYDRSEDPNGKVTLTVESVGASFVDVDFSVNDSAVVSSLNPTSGGTGADATQTTQATVDAAEPVKVFASAVEDTDTLTLVPAEGSGGDGGESARIPYAVHDETENGNAQYSVSYDASDLGGAFDHVEIRYRNRNVTWADGSTASADPRDRSETFTQGGVEGDTYDIVVRAYDGSGNVLAEETVRDVADGVDPEPNGNLREPDSPAVNVERVRDTVSNTNVEYEVHYGVSGGDSFDHLDVRFRNLDNPGVSRTEETTGRSGVVTYSQGGAEGDRYAIRVRVVDDDGIAVDEVRIEDTADGTDPR